MATKHSTKALIAIGVIAITAYVTFSTGMETSETLSPEGVHSIAISGSNLGLRIVEAIAVQAASSLIQAMQEVAL